MSVLCAVARLRLPTQGGEPLEGRIGSHVSSCLVCQAEQVRYRRMVHWLGELQRRDEPAPPTVAATVSMRVGSPLVAVDTPAAAPQVSRTTVAAAAGAVVVAAAVIVGLRRSRAA